MTTTKEKTKSGSKKMDIKDLKPKSDTNHEASNAKTKAIAELRKSQKDADKQLEAINAEEHEFEMKGECLDKNGNKTKVLIINTDKEGFIGVFLENGNPYTLTQQGEQIEDSAKLLRYLEFMSNVDLSDKNNQNAIGMKAIGKARSLVSAFFTLSLVSALNVVDETGA